jgi:cysteine-rich repeat protein
LRLGQSDGRRIRERHAGARASGGSSGASSTTTGGTLDIGLAGSDPGSDAGNGGASDVDTSGCGDGLLQATALGEACDDGNSVSGDGCSADCMAIEANFACLKPASRARRPWRAATARSAAPRRVTTATKRRSTAATRLASSKQAGFARPRRRLPGRQMWRRHRRRRRAM